MKRFGMTCMLKDDSELIKKYQAYHADPWPEVIAGAYKAGVRRVFVQFRDAAMPSNVITRRLTIRYRP